MNFLMHAGNRHKFKLIIKRVVKKAKFGGVEKELPMWGLFTLEDIPAGAFILEYTGEVITKKEGDLRGRQYDKVGMSYLFDMNDPDEDNEFEMNV
jgi:histone-lysine N-methyltransferase SUV39H